MHFIDAAVSNARGQTGNTRGLGKHNFGGRNHFCITEAPQMKFTLSQLCLMKCSDRVSRCYSLKEIKILFS